MNTQFLATKLCSGSVSTPRRTAWWPRHSNWFLRCVESPGKITKANREGFLRSGNAWARFASSRTSHLMIEHTGLELALMEASLERDNERTGKIGKLLYGNVDAMVETFSRAIPHFPATQFHILFDAHIRIGAGLLLERYLKNPRGYKKLLEEQKRNTLALSAFVTEWL